MGRTTDIDTNRGVLRRHFDEVLNLGRLDVVDDLYAHDYVLDAPFGADGGVGDRPVTSGRDGLKRRVELFRTAFPDIVFTVDELFAEGEAAVARYTFRGTQQGPFGDLAATGNPMSVTGILIAHFRDGQIYEAFSAFDAGDMMRQLANP